MKRSKIPAVLRLQKAEGLSRSQAYQRIKEGLDDPEYSEAKRLEKVAAAALRKTQSERAVLALEVERGNLVSCSQVMADNTLIAATLSNQWNSFRNNAPGKLAGLDEIGVRKVLDVEIDLVIDRIRESLIR